MRYKNQGQWTFFSELVSVLTIQLMCQISGVSRMAYPRGANRGRGFGAPGQIEEWRPSVEVLDGGRGLDARSDYFFFR